MYATWFILGLALLITKRYSKSNWLVMHIAHIIIGVVIFIVTLIAGFKVMQFFDYHLHPDYH